VPEPLVCAHCKKPARFYWLVHLEGIEGVEMIRTHGGGFMARRTGQREAEWATASRDVLECGECHATFDSADKAVVPRPIYECRNCGWIGADPDEHTCGAEIESLEPPQVHGGQEQLAI
jgi:hypothetical protein